MADLRRLRDDLAVSAAVIDRLLPDWQAAALALQRRTTVIVAPRQTGKSRGLARSKLGLNLACTAQSFGLSRHWERDGGDG